MNSYKLTQSLIFVNLKNQLEEFEKGALVMVTEETEFKGYKVVRIAKISEDNENQPVCFKSQLSQQA